MGQSENEKLNLEFREQWKLVPFKWMLLKQGMGNGEWGMGNGKWEMGNGKWETENGKWETENGKLNFFTLTFYNVE